MEEFKQTCESYFNLETYVSKAKDVFQNSMKKLYNIPHFIHNQLQIYTYHKYNVLT